jgi:hypothetical protein
MQQCIRSDARLFRVVLLIAELVGLQILTFERNQTIASIGQYYTIM